MIKEVLKKHISNMINDNKLDVLEDLKKEFIGMITYIEYNDFEFTINDFNRYTDFNEHIESYNAMLEKMKHKKDIAIKIYNSKFDELYLVANYLTLDEIHLALQEEGDMDDEWWELLASVSELIGYKITRDEEGNCIEIISK